MSMLFVDPATGWEIPVEGGQVTQGYGPENTDPSVRHLYRKGYHTGIDIGGVAEGTAVRSPRDGKVTLAGENGGYGLCVIVDCADGTQMLFGHLNRIAVTKGKAVLRTQELGGVGTTGVSTGVHLHYEWRRDGTDIDPVPFLIPGGPAEATRLTAVVREDLNLRTGPSKNDPIIRTLPAGTVVQVGKDGWLPVWWEGREGWMYAEYLDVREAPG